MNISGIIVTAMPDKKESVLSVMNGMESIEVQDASLDHTIVAVVEADTPGDATGIFKEVHDIEGVTNVGLTCSYDVDEEEKLAS